jgi:hypothetical protein
MSDYGDQYYSYGPFGGVSIPFPGLTSVIIELYDNNWARKNTFQSGVGDFLSCEFAIDESGGRDFILQFGSYQNIDRTDIVKIRLFYSEDIFFTGVIRNIPIQGSTDSNYIYSGYGFVDYLHRLNAQSQAYANKTIQFILDDLLDNIIVTSSPIIKNVGKIDPPDITITSFNINYAGIVEVLDALRKIADSEGYYIMGVDRLGEFFFKPRNTETVVTLVVGKTGKYGIPNYNPTDEENPTSKIYLLDKDGNHINDYLSDEDIDINEKKETAPDIDNTAAGKWAEGILAKEEVRTRKASILWPIETVKPTVLIADGNIRIISNIPSPTTTAPNPNPFGSGVFGSGIFGGGQYQGYNLDDTLEVKQVRYTLNDSETIRNIELGSLPVSLDSQILGVQKQLNDLEISLGV